MRPTYFVDAWYFIVSIDKRDSDHQRTKRLEPRLATASLLTHEAVLTEVLAFFSEEDSYLRTAAVNIARRALLSMEVISIDRPLFLSALDLYEARPDKEYSLVDCISMVVMRTRGITHVLTNDHHFRQEGFTVLADAP